MEDDHIKKRRQRKSSQREKRWSMNSERLDDIVAQLMKPIGDLRHCFDTDLSALLEEYLTEAGLHALEEDDADNEDEPLSSLSQSHHHTPPVVPPNFAELALLLQQSANIYGRKVDYLYKHVLQVSDSLQYSTIEISNPGGSAECEEPVTPHTDGGQGAADGKRRRRRTTATTGGAGGFDHITLERCTRARREGGAVRPPPTLPRAYLELEPRILPPGVEPMRDYEGEPVGHPTDYQVAWRLSGSGLLVDELGAESDGAGALQPIPLLELQAAIEAAAPPSPPPLALDDDDVMPPPPAPPPPPQSCSTPLPTEPEPKLEPEPPTPQHQRKDRKRRAEDDDCPTTIKLVVTKELLSAMSIVREFDGAAQWTRRVISARAHDIVTLRRSLRGHSDSNDTTAAFQGFDYFNDAQGFLGWSGAEALAARVSAEQSLSACRAADITTTTAGADDSDDDGFFEQSCGTSSVGSELSSSPNDTGYTSNAGNTTVCSAEEAEWAAWRARVMRDAAARDAASCDVRALAAAVLRHVPHSPHTAPASRVLRNAHTHANNAPVSHLFLATLFLANAGNVDIIQGAALTPGAFSLTKLSDDADRYTAAADKDMSTVNVNTPDTVLPTPKLRTDTALPTT